jgi:hypothetical protein
MLLRRIPGYKPKTAAAAEGEPEAAPAEATEIAASGLP